MSGFKPKLWTATGVALLAAGVLSGCGQEDVIKEQPTPPPGGATVPVDDGEGGEGGERGRSADDGAGHRDGHGEAGEGGGSGPG